MSSLSDDVIQKVAAGMAGLYIESAEHEDAILELYKPTRDQGWSLLVWDVAEGLRLVVPGPEGYGYATALPGSTDPVLALKLVQKSRQDPEERILVVMKNLHHQLKTPLFQQAAANFIWDGKQVGDYLIALSPLVVIPPELERHFVLVEHPLPTKARLGEIATSLVEKPEDIPADLDPVLEAAAGLTRLEAENAFSLSITRRQALLPEEIWTQKAQMLRKSGLLELYRGGETFDDLGGLASIKNFCIRSLKIRKNNPLHRARGIMLMGIPGSGKSAFAKALGNETNRPTLILDVGVLMGGLVGQTEAQTRRALKTVDAMAPCILFLDEVEKALAGAGGSGKLDSGVTARMFGALLTWLNDHTSDVFVVCTCNDITRLVEDQPAFVRAERFDGIFFLDLPTPDQKKIIWDLYRELFDIDADEAIPDDRDWTGAEIRACCRLSRVLDQPLKVVSRGIIPIAVTMADQLSGLREWAESRCLSAEQPGRYVHVAGGSSTAPVRRRIKRNDG